MAQLVHITPHKCLRDDERVVIMRSVMKITVPDADCQRVKGYLFIKRFQNSNHVYSVARDLKILNTWRMTEYLLYGFVWKRQECRVRTTLLAECKSGWEVLFSISPDVEMDVYGSI